MAMAWHYPQLATVALLLLLPLVPRGKLSSKWKKCHIVVLAVMEMRVGIGWLGWFGCFGASPRLATRCMCVAVAVIVLVSFCFPFDGPFFRLSTSFFSSPLLYFHFFYPPFDVDRIRWIVSLAEFAFWGSAFIVYATVSSFRFSFDPSFSNLLLSPAPWQISLAINECVLVGVCRCLLCISVRLPYLLSFRIVSMTFDSEQISSATPSPNFPPIANPFFNSRGKSEVYIRIILQCNGEKAQLIEI